MDDGEYRNLVRRLVDHIHTEAFRRCRRPNQRLAAHRAGQYSHVFFMLGVIAFAIGVAIHGF